MEILFGKNGDWTGAKRAALCGIGAGLLAFIVWAFGFSTHRQIMFVERTQLDKIVHFAGGIFIALVFDRRSRTRTRARLLAAIILAAAGWELFEYLFDSDTRIFIALDPRSWLWDTIGDVAAALAAGIVYWRMPGFAEQKIAPAVEPIRGDVNQ